MGLLRLVELSFAEVEDDDGNIPDPGCLFTLADVVYEVVMIGPDTIYAVPVP